MFKPRSKAKTPDRSRDDAKPAVETPKRESQPRTLELQDLTKVGGGLLPKGGWGQR